MKGGVKAVIVIILLIGLAAIVTFEIKNTKRIKGLESKLKQLEIAVNKVQNKPASESPFEKGEQGSSARHLMNKPASESPFEKGGERGISNPPQPSFTEGGSNAEDNSTGSDMKVFTDSISEKGLCGAFSELAEKGDILCAHAARILKWKLDARRDFHKGDKITVLYEWREQEKEPTLLALDFSGSTKLQAYRFKLSGDQFPSYFNEQGVEIPARLDNSPINEYEQITSFFGDKRGRQKHNGVDFKAPVGTPVYTPFDGVVTRHNWNWRANGNCLEIKVEGQNLYAIFLHLNEEFVKVGEKVQKGQMIAKTGNTGIVTAPHLHYQIDRANGNERKPLDPLKQHRLYHRQLEGAELEAFKAEVVNLKSFLQSNP